MKNIFLLFLLLLSTNAFAFETASFLHSAGIAVDADRNSIYVANVNGRDNEKDGNGFISRLNDEGSIQQLHFIDSSKEIKLNAPKGLAVLNNKLYITDINLVHVYSLEKNRFLDDIPFTGIEVGELYAITPTADNELYTVDAQKNAVYKIDAEGKVSVFVQDDSLGQPRNIVWHPLNEYFLISGWSSGQVQAYDKKAQKKNIPSLFLRTLEGMTIDGEGKMYLSSASLRSIYVLERDFTLRDFKLDLNSPQNLAYHINKKEILVNLPTENKIVSFPVK